ncbi:type II toxin-antitoxin system Phd/YefM family antitoxin [Microbacterium sp.]|uniref:type II toxin-antitoxin system Phd/YefM family antitoxin n=1 Tax=Microbacterium sp. TaxID=51671 RepID=UPI0039E2B9B3
MNSVNIHDAKTRFSRLVDAAASGETIVIAKAGRPVAKLVRVDAPMTQVRTGFLAGRGSVPDDFDTMAADAIADRFEGTA